MGNAALLRTDKLEKHFDLRAGMLGQLLGRKAPTVRAVDGVTLGVDEKEVVALVGESGSGKTTIGKLACRLELPTGGEIRFGDVSVPALRGTALKRFRQNVQMIFQNPYESLDPRYTIGATIVEPLVLHGIGSSTERKQRAQEALNQVELRPAADFMERLPQDLSGGQRQRVAIARALVLNPRLIVADEPVSMLDVSIRSGIMNLMDRLREEHDMAYLYITHDLAVARYMASRMAVMYLGRIVEEGPTDVLIHEAGHPYTRLLLAAVPGEHVGGRERVVLQGEAAAISRIPDGCRFHPRCPLAQPICREQDPPHVPLGDGRYAACHFASDVASMRGPGVQAL
jgi:oligopeptide/dipeptide ABC transporter ATP-binding protein